MKFSFLSFFSFLTASQTATFYTISNHRILIHKRMVKNDLRKFLIKTHCESIFIIHFFRYICVLAGSIEKIVQNRCTYTIAQVYQRLTDVLKKKFIVFPSMCGVSMFGHIGVSKLSIDVICRTQQPIHFLSITFTSKIFRIKKLNFLQTNSSVLF